MVSGNNFYLVLFRDAYYYHTCSVRDCLSLWSWKVIQFPQTDEVTSHVLHATIYV